MTSLTVVFTRPKHVSRKTGMSPNISWHPCARSARNASSSKSSKPMACSTYVTAALHNSHPSGLSTFALLGGAVVGGGGGMVVGGGGGSRLGPEPMVCRSKTSASHLFLVGRL